MQNHLFIFGYGSTANALAKNLNPDKWIITGTSRSKTKDEYCKILSYNRFEIEASLQSATHLLISIPKWTGAVYNQKWPFSEHLTNQC